MSIKGIIKFVYFSIRDVISFRRGSRKDIVIIVNKNSVKSNDKFEEIKLRLLYFDPEINIIKASKLSFFNSINNQIISFIGFKPSGFLSKLKTNLIFDFDFDNNFEDGWEYHRFLAHIQFREIKKNRVKIKKRLSLIKHELIKRHDKTYIFGTGPSLEKAFERRWDDGVRIVSNTIVKDKQLWDHIKPDFIVAGDAIYHFGFSSFAKAFRKDLIDRMSESEVYFVFQEHFFPFVKKELPQFIDRLIPIPINDNVAFYDCIEKEFRLPNLGNVLNGLLLPLSSYFSKNIYLWGFDGRAPDDKLFWKNSDKHFYSDLVPELQELHPAFFNMFVPKDNPSKYVQSVHGDTLNKMLRDAEKKREQFLYDAS